MKSLAIRIAGAAALALAFAAPAQAQSFECITQNSSESCSAATAGVTWDLMGDQLTITNNAAGSNVAEFYFDTSAGMTVALGSTTGTVNLVGGAVPNATAPGELPGGNAVDPDFSSNFSWDSGSGSVNGVNFGESATFSLGGVTLADFTSGAIRVGLHVRSLFNDESEGLVTTPPIPEPGTYALILAGLGAITLVARRRRIS